MKGTEDKGKIKERGPKSKAGKYRLLLRHREIKRGMKVFICPVGEERRAGETSKVSCRLKNRRGPFTTLGLGPPQARPFNSAQQHKEQDQS